MYRLPLRFVALLCAHAAGLAPGGSGPKNVAAAMARQIAGGRMIRFDRAWRTGAVLVAAVSLAACRDVGLDGNIPLAEAENRQFRYNVYQMAEGPDHAGVVVRIGDRRWMRAGPPQSIPAALLTPIAEVDGRSIHALAWDRPPYTTLYARTEDGRWIPHAELP
jgi:hypothetical protein